MILYAVINNKLNGIDVRDIGLFEREFHDYMDTFHRDIGKEIISTGDLSRELSGKLDAAIEEFTEDFFSGRRV